MLLCRREHILDLLLVKYVDACEKQNPGLVDRTIEAVSGEIADALSYRYPQPVVEAVTSLVDTEETGNNEWIPLQKQWKYCTELLEDIASGKRKLPLAEANPDREDPTFAVVSRPPLFDLRGL